MLQTSIRHTCKRLRSCYFLLRLFSYPLGTSNRLKTIAVTCFFVYFPYRAIIAKRSRLVSHLIGQPSLSYTILHRHTLAHFCCFFFRLFFLLRFIFTFCILFCSFFSSFIAFAVFVFHRNTFYYFFYQAAFCLFYHK